MTPIPELDPVPPRFRRYATLRAAQRALSPIRTLPDRLPAEEILKEVRDRLQATAPETEAPAEKAEEIARTEAEIDRMLEEVAGEFLSIVEGVSFSELRAALPRARRARPRDVAALLDLCLEPQDPSPRLLSVIDYVTTLLATEVVDTGTRLVVDPLSVTPDLRRRCERFTDYDTEEVQGYVAAFDEVITDLSRSESIDAVLSRARELKTRLGRLRFAPELLRKIVEYNLAATNRLEDTIEAERLLHELDLETVTLPNLELETRPPDAGPGSDPPAPPTEGTEGVTPEDREREAIATVAAALSRRLDGYTATREDVSQLAHALELSILSAWERKAFRSDDGSSESELLRAIVVVGLLLKTAETLPTLLARVGLPGERLREKWVPELEGRAQETIAQKLRGCAHREARRLSQTRSKFLYRAAGSEAPKGDAPARVDPPSPDPISALEGGRERKFAPFAPRRRRLLRSGPSRLHRRVILLGLGLVAAAALGLYFSGRADPRSVRVLPSDAVAELSSFLESGYRDGLGNGPTFVGTVGREWQALSNELQRGEITRIASRLRWTGVREIMLFDPERRLRGRWVTGEILYPRPEGRSRSARASR